MNKTLTQLKKDAKSGNIALRLVERYGDKKIPERLQGIREICEVHCESLVLKNKNSEKSYLFIKRASLIDYTNDRLIIYEPCKRDLNKEEQKIMDEYKLRQKEYYEQNPYGDFYWQGKDFLKNSAAPWLSETDYIKGKRYSSSENKIYDSSIKGDCVLVYEVVHKRKATNIQWDTEDVSLPEEIIIPETITDEDIPDYISNVTGFCHKGFNIICL